MPDINKNKAPIKIINLFTSELNRKIRNNIFKPENSVNIMIKFLDDDKITDPGTREAAIKKANEITGQFTRKIERGDWGNFTHKVNKMIGFSNNSGKDDDDPEFENWKNSSNRHGVSGEGPPRPKGG